MYSQLDYYIYEVFTLLIYLIDLVLAFIIFYAALHISLN